MGYHRITVSCCGELLLATYPSIRLEQFSEDNILGSPHQRMQLTFDDLKLCLLCTYFEATCKDYFEMCFNNGFVIEVLLFPKQVHIVLGLVSSDAKSTASLNKRCCYLCAKVRNIIITTKEKPKKNSLLSVVFGFYSQLEGKYCKVMCFCL